MRDCLRDSRLYDKEDKTDGKDLSRKEKRIIQNNQVEKSKLKGYSINGHFVKANKLTC